MSHTNMLSMAPQPRGRSGEPGFAPYLPTAVVNQIGCGLIACDGHGELRFANRVGHEELASARALKLVDDVVRAAKGSNAALHLALQRAAKHGRRQMLTLGGADDALMATVLPLPTEGDDATPSVLIMLGRRGPCSALGMEMLGMAHGLTLTERRVFMGLLANEKPRKIAADSGVAVSTVRTQIASIRAKLGVSSIEALVIRAAEVPPVTTVQHRFGGDAWEHVSSRVSDSVLSAA